MKENFQYDRLVFENLLKTVETSIAERILDKSGYFCALKVNLILMQIRVKIQGKVD